MRLLFRSGGAYLDRVLLVESGSRALAERFLANLYNSHPAERVDVLTCYAGEPENFDAARGQVISVHGAQSANQRFAFLKQLARNNYSVVAILCSKEAIMTPWKLAAAMRIPAKLLIVNENADYFWFDTGNLANLLALIKNRLGVHPGFHANVAAKVLIAPFVYLYLLANAGLVHGRRFLRRAPAR